MHLSKGRWLTTRWHAWAVAMVALPLQDGNRRKSQLTNDDGDGCVGVQHRAPWR